MSDVVAAVAERISLRCPITQQRISQAIRLSGCTHATCFCSAAIPTLTSAGIYRCPLCGNEASEFAVDVQCTLFLTSHPTAETVAVRRLGDAWQYSKPKAQQRAKPRRRVAPQPQPSMCGVGGSGGGGSISGSISGSCRSSGSGSALVVDCGARRSGGGSSGSSATSLNDPPRASSTRNGTGAMRNKAEERATRRQAAARAKLLEATRAALIRRALHEDSSTGEALFSTRY